MSPYLSDEEVDDICDGYTQSAAKIRYLRSLGLVVTRKPNGRPLVQRLQFEQARVAGGAKSEPNWSA